MGAYSVIGTWVTTTHRGRLLSLTVLYLLAFAAIFAVSVFPFAGAASGKPRPPSSTFTAVHLTAIRVGGAAWVSCPASRTCYAVADTDRHWRARSGQAEEPRVLLRSTNGGHSWTALTLPDGEYNTTTSMSCPTTRMCVMGFDGTRTSQSAGGVFITRDGGATWSTIALPTGDGSVGCRNATDCFAATSGRWYWTRTSWATSAPHYGPRYDGPVACPTAHVCYVPLAGFQNVLATLERTTDGGASWSNVGKIPELSFVQTLACPAVDRCYAGAYAYTPLVLMTADGGARWRAEGLPGGSDHGVYSLSCPAVNVCEALVRGLGGRPDEYPHLFRTTDGGASWLPQPLPGSISDLQAVSCANVEDCAAVGSRTADQHGTYGTRPELLSTDNGGATWSIATVR